MKDAFQTLVPPAAQPVSVRSIPARRVWHHAPTILATAASFVVALGLGLLGRGFWSGDSVAARQGLGGSAPGTLAVQARQATGASSMLPDTAWRMVTLKVPDAQRGGSRSIDLPAVEQNRLDENWVRSLPEPLSPELVRALQRSGHTVQQSRQLLPMPLDDGRRLVVPIDQVDVHYVGNAAYQ